MPGLIWYSCQWFFQTLDELYLEKIVEEELICRMASKWEKVVDKAASKALGHKPITCGRSVNWWAEEFVSLWRIIEIVLLKV